MDRSTLVAALSARGAYLPAARREQKIKWHILPTHVPAQTCAEACRLHACGLAVPAGHSGHVPTHRIACHRQMAVQEEHQGGGTTAPHTG
jgi:hypothetical protein